jgi:hypothetical protein
MGCAKKKARSRSGEKGGSRKGKELDLDDLLAEAAAIGITPTEFWTMTPRELRTQFMGAGKARKRDMQLALYGAWHAGAFARYNPKKKLPDLKQLLYRLGENEQMSDDQLRGALLGWHKQYGGTVRVVPKGTVTGSRKWLQ